MQSQWIRWSIPPFAVLLCVAALAWAQDEVRVEQEQVDITAEDDRGDVLIIDEEQLEAMTVDAEQADEMLDADAEMEAWMEVSEPGPEHAVLDVFVGVWRVSSTIWMAPDTEPTQSETRSDIRWILGKRFLAEAVMGTMDMGGEEVPFEGFGVTGYDNLAGQYVGTWMDTMSTSIYSFTGDFDVVTQTLTMTGEYEDPMTGQPAVMRSEVTFVSEDEIVTKMYQQVGDAPEYQCLELVYTPAE